MERFLPLPLARCSASGRALGLAVAVSLGACAGSTQPSRVVVVSLLRCASTACTDKRRT